MLFRSIKDIKFGESGIVPAGNTTVIPNCKILFRKKESPKLHFEKLHFSHIEEVVAYLNSIILRKFKFLTQLQTKKQLFVYDQTLNIVDFVGIPDASEQQLEATHTKLITSLVLSPQLGAMLGISSQEEPHLTHKQHGEYFPDLLAGYKLLMIYSDFVEESLVGNKSYPLLAILPAVTRQPGEEVITFEPSNLMYKRVPHSTQHIERIRITIASETGSILQYSQSKTHPVTVILHLRERAKCA